jgi:hypothetical protein
MNQINALFLVLMIQIHNQAFLVGRYAIFLLFYRLIGMIIYKLFKYKQFLENKKKNLSKKTIEIFAFRDRYKKGVRNIEHSLIFDINLMTDVTQATPITTVGWERNEKNNLIPKIVNYFYIYFEMIYLIFNLIKKRLI